MAKDVKVQIVGDATKFKSALQDASASSDKFSQKTKSNGDEMSKFGLGALAVGGAIGVGLFKAGEAASDLGESVNAVQVTFGKSAAGILKLGENAATAVGLSNTAFNGLAVQFSSFATTIAGKGGDVVSTMSEMTGRAADFASVMNIDVAEAARLFQSGLAGETEPLKKFGIDLSAAAVNAFAASHGIGTLGSELSETEKVTARYGLLMESTAKTQGDFANTSDSAANATRIAKAEFENAAASLGSVVAPVMAEVASKAATLVKGFADLNESSGGVLVGFTAFIGGGALILGSVIKITAGMKKMHDALFLAEGGFTTAGKAAAITGGVIAVASLATVAATAYYSDNAKKKAHLTEVTNAFADALKDEEDGQVGAVDAAIAKELADKDLIAAAKKLGLETKDLAAIVRGDAVPAWNNLQAANEKYGLTAGTASQVSAQLGRDIPIDEMDELQRAFNEVNGKLAPLNDGLVIANDQLALEAQVTAELNSVLRDGEKSWETQTGWIEKAGAASAETDRETRRLTEGMKGGNEAFEGAKRPIDNASKALGEFRETIAEVDGAYRALTGKLDEEEAWENVNEAIKEFGKGTRASAEDVRGITRDIAEYVVNTDTIPAEKKTEILTLLDEGKLAYAKAVLAEVTKNRDIYLNLIATGSGDIIAKLGAVGAHAAGGRIPMSEGLSVVGEDGPELISSPGSMVYTAGQTAGMLGGGGTTNVTINVNAGMGTDGYQVAKQMVNALGEYDRRNGTHIVTPAGR